MIRSRTRQAKRGAGDGFNVPGIPFPVSFAYDFTIPQINPIIGGGTTTVSTSANGWYFNSAGLLVQNTANNPRFDYGLESTVISGLRIEEARTISTVWSRDLSNAAWTKTNCTAVKNAQGIDGIASSCTTLTATAGNATCLQTLTAAATNRAFAPYIRRVSGSGTIQYTQDGGASWTTISTASNVWTRAPDLVVSQLNPQFGFRIVTNGDAIAVDFVNLDPGTFATSPISTDGAAVTRAADNISSLLGSWFNATEGTFVVEWIEAVSSAPANRAVIEFGDGTSNERYVIFRGTGSANASFITVDGGANQCVITPGAVTALQIMRMANAYKANDFGAALNGVSGTPDTNGTLPTVTNLYLGNRAGTLEHINGWLRKVYYSRVRAPNNSLQRASRR